MGDSIFHNAVDRWHKTVLAIVAMGFGIASFVNPIINSDWYINKAEETMIEEKVHDEAEHELHDMVKGEFKNEIQGLKNSLAQHRGHLNRHDGRLDKIEGAIDSVDVKADYAIENISIHSDLFCEQMVKMKAEKCEYTYRRSHAKDPWNKFEGQYGCREMNSLELKSDCSVYRIPTGGKTKVRVL